MKYKICRNVLWRIVDDEVVIVNTGTDEYSYLNSTGSEIWQMIDTGLELKNILNNLSKEYNMPAETLTKETESIINDLLKSKLITRCSAR